MKVTARGISLWYNNSTYDCIGCIDRKDIEEEKAFEPFSIDKKKLIKLVQKDRLKKCLEFLAETDNSTVNREAVLLQGHLESIDKEKRIGCVSLDDYLRFRNQIRRGTLELIYELQ